MRSEEIAPNHYNINHAKTEPSGFNYSVPKGVGNNFIDKFVKETLTGLGRGVSTARASGRAFISSSGCCVVGSPRLHCRPLWAPHCGQALCALGARASDIG